MDVYLRLLGFLAPHRARLAVAVTATLVVAATTALYAFLLGPLLKVLLSGATAIAGVPVLSRLPADRLLVVLPTALVAAAAVRALAQAAQTWLMQTTGQRVVAAVRRALYARYLGLPQAYLGERRTGDLVARFGADVQGLEFAVTAALGTSVRDVLQVLALLGVCAWMDARLFLAAVAVVPLAAWPLSRYSRALKEVFRRSQEGLGELTAHVGEAVANVRVVQGFAREEHELGRLDEAQRGFLALQRRSFLLRAAYSPVIEFLGVVGLAAAVAFATGAIAQGDLTGEALLSFLAALMLLYQPLKSLAATSQHVSQGLAGARRVFELLDAPGALPEPVEAPPPTLQQGVSLQGVDFAYEPGVPVLHGVDLEIPRGRTVALVGESGSGKSTVAALLLRFWDPTAGSVLFDGRDARTARLADLRRLVAYVPQDPVLFDGTVRDNVGCGRPEADDEAIVAALRSAHAWDFVQELPGGLDAGVGERGARLSGGQRQRLALARALLVRAPLLVLDEATSAIDSASEAAVQRGVEALLRDQTALVIAHRLSTVERADEVVVLSQGRVVERGTHGELLAAGGAYAALWAAHAGAAPG